MSTGSGWNGMYTRDEISRMTDNALNELWGYYVDKGNREGAARVHDEQMARQDDEQAEMEHEAVEAHKQQMHDEMVDDMLARDGRWG